MVVFTCQHCGEPVKKPLVSKHYERKCHGRVPNLTCVDCLKDFRDNEYEAHTKCISEQERYGAKGSIPPNSVNKGEQKQQLWSECIQNVLNTGTLRDDEKRLLKLLIKHENVPRKKAKFQNFLNSAYKSCRFSNELIDRVWVRMEKVFKETAGNNSNNKQGNLQATDEKMNQPESKKRKHEEEKQTNQDDPASLADDSEVKKSKKSKKKNKEGNPDPTTEAENNLVIPDEAILQSESSKKDKKKKKTLESEDKIIEKIEESVPIINLEGNKKKKKKTLESEDKIIEKIEESVPIVNGEGNKKKKKKTLKSEDKIIEETKESAPINNGEGKKKKKKNEVANENAEVTGNKENRSEGNKVQENPGFNWMETIKSVLSKKNLEEEILIKKIEKKVLKKYHKATGNDVTEKQSMRFRKKLKQLKNIIIKDEYVIRQK